jgi:hypothetical protein
MDVGWAACRYQVRGVYENSVTRHVSDRSLLDAHRWSYSPLLQMMHDLFFRLAPPGYAEDAEPNSLELLPILLGGHSASFTRLSNVTRIDSTITTSLSNVSETVKKITITASHSAHSTGWKRRRCRFRNMAHSCCDLIFTKRS